VFFGSGTFAIPLLRALLGHEAVVVVGVVGPPDRPAGRRGEPRAVPIVAEAQDLGLPILQPERLRAPEAAAAIADLRPDLGFLADFGRIVPPSILELPPHGILNLHPSLLPRHRGATPIAATILAGDPTAGVTVMKMDEGLDTGPVLASRAWALEGRETAIDLEARAAIEGAALATEVLGPYLRGELAARAQAGTPTLTRPLRRDDGRLDPARTAIQLERQVRAYQPWPGSFLELPTGRLTLLAAEAVEAGVGAEAAGSLVADGDGLALATSAGCLRLLEIQPAGGRSMTGSAYRRGHPTVVGQIVVPSP